MQKWLIALSVIGLIAVTVCITACGGAALFFSSSTRQIAEAKESAEEFLNKIEIGDAEGAYESASEEFRDATSFAEFENVIARLPGMPRANRQLGFITFARTPGATRATFRGMSNGKSCTISLKKTGNKWTVYHLGVP